MSTLMLSSHLFLGLPFFSYTARMPYIVTIFLVLSSPCGRTIAVVLSEEGYHWFNVIFSPNVFMLYVVHLCLASCLSQHSHISGVMLMCIVTVPHSNPCLDTMLPLLTGISNNAIELTPSKTNTPFAYRGWHMYQFNVLFTSGFFLDLNFI